MPILRREASHGAMSASGGDGAKGGDGSLVEDDRRGDGGEDQNEKGKGKKGKYHPHHTQWTEEEVEAWLRDTPPFKRPQRQYGSSSAHPPTRESTSFWPGKAGQSSSGGMMQGSHSRYGTTLHPLRSIHLTK